jgi:glycosyltransferase involved in cell wall biosynthesis
MVMKRFPSAVFIEDDCLPMPGFYAFMHKALELYEGEKRVFSIGGYQPIRPGYFRGYPYSVISCARFTCWGWATWQDRWELIRPILASPEKFFNGLNFQSGIAGADLPTYARAIADGEVVNSWDVRVALACLGLKKVHLLPVGGLVRNIGLDRSGIHGGWKNTVSNMRLHNRNVVEDLPNPIWMDDVDLNCDYAYELKEFVNKTRGISVSHLLDRGKVILRRYVWQRRENLFNLYLLNDNPAKLTRKALLSYITHPFYISPNDSKFIRHINIWHAHEIVRVLNRLGYAVDVIDYRDDSFVVKQPYDLFIGHGGVNFEVIVRQLPALTKKIYFSTGSYWKFHNEQEISRLEDLHQRRGIRLPSDRYINHSEEEALLHADGVIGIGNDVTRSTYADFSPVIMINGTSLYDDHFEWCPKNFDIGRQHYLYFAGGGNLHKGLDLLLEAFTELEQHLWICSSIDRAFASVYSEELDNCDNIHTKKWTKPRSRQFYQVMQRCNYCILPSCSEGQSQSVVECMNQGLIPIVSKAAGVQIGDFGVLIEPCTVLEIRKLVKLLSSFSPAQCQEISLRARANAQAYFSEKRFGRNFQRAIETILAS